MRVLQVNLNDCAAAHDLLGQTARELRIDLASISEPYYHFGSRGWTEDSSQGAAVWICGNDTVEATNNGEECGFVRVRVAGRRIYSCYAPPSLSIEDFTAFFDRLTADAHHHFPVAISGDFNAWATEWGSRATNSRGQAVLEAMASLDLVLLNRGDAPTYARGESTSIVDLTFVSDHLAREGHSWEVSEVFTASDHRALLWEVRTTRRPVPAAARTNAAGWRASSFDPAVFSVALGQSAPMDGLSTKEKVAETMRRVARACDASMLRKRTVTRKPPVHWWSEYIAAIRRDCIAVRRAVQRARRRSGDSTLENAYRQARGRLTKAIKRSKIRAWNELLAQVEDDPWGRPYTVVMARLKYQPIQSLTCPVLLGEIVEALFPKQAVLERTNYTGELPGVPPVTRGELIDVCGRVGNAKSPGLDGIPNIALKAAVQA
ncbi:uncharacterized protein [Fopius arisanus]|uniref:Endonuclease/exonuclease/phosphatase domain-containing protein n=1 Tax=Fopius arisanus TaxID=64838 RepID=A0A9R1TQB5_9HYME|nr:PREDICTED: uncharacterized protein LOC105272793 [Fopius arisanus]